MDAIILLTIPKVKARIPINSHIASRLNPVTVSISLKNNKTHGITITKPEYRPIQEDIIVNAILIESFMERTPYLSHKVNEFLKPPLPIHPLTNAHPQSVSIIRTFLVAIATTATNIS